MAGDFQLESGDRWYCVRTQPRKESLAAQNLHRQGFRTFLPRLTKTVRHARKTRTVKAALFPGYLFTTLDMARDQWRRINGTIGVLSLIMEDIQPQPVPPGVVEAIIDLTGPPGALRTAKPSTGASASSPAARSASSPAPSPTNWAPFAH